MNATAAQWIGCRDHQEDAYGVKHFPGGTLAIVCDGMGGHCCGDLAAKTAAAAFAGVFAAPPSDQEEVPERLHAALMAANEAVGRIFAGGTQYGGTTLTALYASGSLLWWVSVGDSPLMLWRGNHLQRLNADHSMRAVYEEFAHQGAISFKDAMSQGHMLRSALTGEEIPMVDLSRRAHILLPGDRLVLASDGVEHLLFTPLLSTEAKLALSSPFTQAAAAVVEACRAIGDPYADNATVVLLEV